MKTFSALLPICAGNSPVTDDFPTKSQLRGSLMFSLILCLNRRLSKQPWGWWFETPSWSFWCHCNEFSYNSFKLAFVNQIALIKRIGRHIPKHTQVTYCLYLYPAPQCQCMLHPSYNIVSYGLYSFGAEVWDLRTSCNSGRAINAL